MSRNQWVILLILSVAVAFVLGCECGDGRRFSNLGWVKNSGVTSRRAS